MTEETLPSQDTEGIMCEQGNIESFLVSEPPVLLNSDN